VSEKREVCQRDHTGEVASENVLSAVRTVPVQGQQLDDRRLLALTMFRCGFVPSESLPSDEKDSDDQQQRFC
jgi:hypothetical protein